MKAVTYIRSIAVFLALLVVSLPICFADTISLTYDANGNLVSGDGLYRKYNSLNQLWKVYNGSSDSDPLLQEFTYHPTEERVLVKKTYSGGVLQDTTYYVSKEFVRVVNSSGTYDYTYVYHEGQLIAQRNPDSSKYFIHTDHLGSSTVVSDENGAVIENSSYAPYGAIISGGETTRYDYEGKEFDSTTGSYDFHFRGYRPDWGIFTQPDSLLPNVYDPQSLNRYSFERNNPYKYVDPDGHVEGVFWTIVGITVLYLWVYSKVAQPRQEKFDKWREAGYMTRYNTVEERRYRELYSLAMEQNPDMYNDPYMSVLHSWGTERTRRYSMAQLEGMLGMNNKPQILSNYFDYAGAPSLSNIYFDSQGYGYSMAVSNQADVANSGGGGGSYGGGGGYYYDDSGQGYCGPPPSSGGGSSGGSGGGSGGGSSGGSGGSGSGGGSGGGGSYYCPPGAYWC